MLKALLKLNVVFYYDKDTFIFPEVFFVFINVLFN